MSPASPGSRRLDPAEALLRRTGTSLAAVTLATVTALVVLVGVTTAVTATTLMLESIDRALEVAAADPSTLHELAEGEDDDDDDERASAVGGADTFVLLTDAEGNLLGSTADMRFGELPDRAAIAASASGVDRRQETFDGLEVRLLTRPVSAAQLEEEDELQDAVRSRGPLFVQAGFVLTLHVQQERQLLEIIAVVGLLGIAGAAAVTLVVTRRAMAPIHEAFATERRFVAAASHELRTPVSIIRASAEILDREGLVQPAGTALVEDIVSETDRLGRLVGDLLELASAQAGAMPLYRQPLDLGTWFEQLVRRARSVVEREGLAFKVDRPLLSVVASTMADRDRLDQLVLILLDNAVKHSPAGAVVTLGLAIDTLERRGVISVSDQGAGIPPAEHERVFEPFARLPGIGRTDRGSGLGLAIARQLARRHGGELTVASGPSGGTTFAVEIPLSSPGVVADVPSGDQPVG